MLLAFDTATPAVTVALHDAGRILASRTTVDARRHGELLAVSIAAVLAEAGVDRRDLTGVAVGTGPGPFTGLRVGLVTARTLGLVLAVPVHGVVTLDVLARQAVEEGTASGRRFLVATDARRKEVYAATYDAAGARLDGPHVLRPADAASTDPVAGEGARLYPDAFPHAVGPELPDAAVLARGVAEGGLTSGAPAPLYLRRPDVAAPAPPKRVS